MKKKQLPEERHNTSKHSSKPPPSTKSKRSKLLDITNASPSPSLLHKHKPQSKSIKSITKPTNIFKTLQSSKQCRNKNKMGESTIVQQQQPRYGSASGNIMMNINVEEFGETMPSEIVREERRVEGMWKEKIGKLEEENRFIGEMNRDMKMELKRAHEEVLEGNKVQSEMRERNKELVRKLDEEEEKWREKEVEYKNKIRSINRQLEESKQEKEFVANKFNNNLKNQRQIEIEKYQLMVEKLEYENSRLIKQKEELKNKYQNDIHEKQELVGKLEIKIKSFEVQIQNGYKMHQDLITKVINELNKVQASQKAISKQNTENQLFNMILEIDKEMNNLRLLNNTTISNYQQQKIMKQNYVNQQISNLTSQQYCLKQNIDNLQADLESKNQQIFSLIQQLKAAQSNNQTNIKLQQSRIINKKYQQTKISLEYWKKKFDECKLQNIKLKKQSEIQHEDIKVSLEKVRRLQEEKSAMKASFETDKKQNKQKTKDILRESTNKNRIEIEELKKQNIKLKAYKVEMDEEKQIMKQKLSSFKQNIKTLETKLKSQKIILKPTQSEIHETPRKQDPSSSYILNQSAIISKFNQNQFMFASPSHRSEIKSTFQPQTQHHHQQRLKSHQKTQNNYNLMEYKGDTQAKLESQFRSNKMMYFSPEKSTHLSMIISKNISQ